ncbi:MAG: hypothetical protein RR627_08165, partial [Niameybacter sp.]
NFTILHGECVAYGMVMAAWISFKRGLCTQTTLETIKSLCDDYHLLQPLQNIELDKVVAHVVFDKKKSYGQVPFILIYDIGQVDIIKDVTEDEMRQALIYTQETCQ